jgi:hypothetical protein
VQLQIKVSYGPQNKTQKCRQKTRSLARRDDCLHGTHKPPEQKAISCLHPINFHVDVVKKSRFREREKKILHEVMAESSFFFRGEWNLRLNTEKRRVSGLPQSDVTVMV